MTKKEQELIINPPQDIGVDSYNIKGLNDIKQELARALHDKGLNMSLVADKLKSIIDEAITMNNKGDTCTDYKTMLEAIKVLLKISGIDLSDNKINIAVFNNIPAKGEKLNF